MFFPQCFPRMMEAPTPPANGRAVPRFIRERRWWVALLMLWAIAIGIYTHLHLEQMREQTTQVALAGARNMFRMVILTRKWNASHGGIYVPVSQRVEPNPYLDHPKRDLTTSDGVQLTMINPAYMTRLIAEMAESSSGAIFRLTSLKPIRPENKPDTWEGQSLLAFESGIKETFAVAEGKDGMMLRYMAPLPVEESCLTCHRKQGYQLGDIRGGISVSQRYEPIENAMRSNTQAVLLATGSAFVLAALLGWLLLELLRRRWLELASKVQELQETQSQLLQSEKMASIGQLAAGVAHEINNPIGFVNSNLGTLKNYTSQLLDLAERSRKGEASEADFVAADFDYLKTDIDDLLRESRDGLERVKKIVADLKDFSHVDETEWQEADLNAGIESTLNVVWNELKYKAEVIREYGDLPRVPCVAAQINQVVMNLLVNAAHAIESRGTITVRTGHDDAHAWIEVADTGQGMTPAVIQRIFEPFYTTKPVGKGTGLGLSLSYDIVKKHGGHIDVSSQVGVGTTFRVTLPLQPPASPPSH